MKITRTSHNQSIAAQARRAGVLACLMLTAPAAYAQAPSGHVPTEAELARMEAAQLKKQNQTLSVAVADAKKAEASAAEQLSQIKLRLEALGKNMLDGGDDRLKQAAADNEILKERLAATEKAAMNLAAATNDFIRQAVVSDPESRLRIETATRELDSVLGMRQKPLPNLRTGTLTRAQIISIDQESGLIVANVGTAQDCRIGMTYTLSRGERNYGKAIIADVRKDVAGAFIETLDTLSETPRLGDTLILNTEQK